MVAYARLTELLLSVSSSTAPDAFASGVTPYLTDEWLDDYARSAPSRDIVETTLDRFSYLFDIAQQRLIAAWGVSAGRHGAPRPAARMAGHPLSEGPRYHRGHAIPHTLGGGTDMNLVSQLGSMNIGPFRALERQAVATPGALYFTHWIYAGPDPQKPLEIEQGLLYPGRAPDIRRFRN
jgi:hypothetical protein